MQSAERLDGRPGVTAMKIFKNARGQLRDPRFVRRVKEGGAV